MVAVYYNNERIRIKDNYNSFIHKKGMSIKMKVTCGVDIIEVKRIEKAIISTDENFLDRVYTKEEIQYCNSKGITKYEHYAARFAAKEAVLKAVSSGLNSKYDLDWKDVEILNDKEGRPYVNLKNEIKPKVEIDLSLSHIKEYAVANCVATWN